MILGSNIDGSGLKKKSKESENVRLLNEDREKAGHVLLSSQTNNSALSTARSGGSTRGSSGLSTNSYLRKHLSDHISDDKGTQIVPPTSGVAGKLESEKTQGAAAGGSIRRNIKATVLTFRAIVDRPNVARVQLLLCNISDRALYFKLKSNVGSNISALPAGDGEIPPRAQVRIVLTWTRPGQHEHWRNVPSPKLLISTRFMDSIDDSKASTTSIRLIARVSASKTCYASNPPVEQLLLDAVGKTENMEVSSVLHETNPMSDKSHESNSANQVATNNVVDILNSLDDRGLLVLIILLLAFMYIVNRLCDRPGKQS